MKNQEIKLNDHDKWKGSYKGVSFSVSKWRRGKESDYIWNYYIDVKPREIKIRNPEDGEKYVDYYGMYSDVEMHGDISYWSRHQTSQLQEFDELGCDYGHIFDEKRLIDLETVLRDVKHTIDNLPSDLFFKSNNT